MKAELSCSSAFVALAGDGSLFVSVLVRAGQLEKRDIPLPKLLSF